MGLDRQIYLGPYIECPFTSDSPHRYIDWDDTQGIDLRSADPASEIAWFRDAFAIEIDALEEAYGKVTLRWGLCQLWA